jgi:hypothetical protein
MCHNNCTVSEVHEFSIKLLWDFSWFFGWDPNLWAEKSGTERRKTLKITSRIVKIAAKLRERRQADCPNLLQ